jgi:putative tryptophan/tyrosine transport system substrate-binding protein
MPRHRRTPIVPHDHRSFGAERIKEAHHIADEMKQGVLIDRFRSVGSTVTAHIRRDGVESGCRQRRELVTPRVPALREAVAQNNERPFPLLGKVEMDAVRLDHAMRDSAAALPVDLIELEDGSTRRRSESRREFAPLHPCSPRSPGELNAVKAASKPGQRDWSPSLSVHTWPISADGQTGPMSAPSESRHAGAWPVVALGQPAGKTYRVGYLAFSPGEDATWARTLLDRLQELGYFEAQNMTFDYRSAECQRDQLPSLAIELVRGSPDVLIAGNGTLTAQALKAATTTIPIVFTGVGDPVGVGLVASLSRPGGNITGLSAQGSDLIGKRLQLLRQLIPGKPVIAVLMNPDTPYALLALKEAQGAAERMNVRLEVLEITKADQLPGKIAAAAAMGVAGLLMIEDPLAFALRRQTADLAAQARLPASHGFREFVEVGGLMSYGTDPRQLARRAAEFVDKLLKGTKPADLPVEQPIKGTSNNEKFFAELIAGTSRR